MHKPSGIPPLWPSMDDGYSVVLVKTLPTTAAELAEREAFAEGEETLQLQMAAVQNNKMIGNDLTRGAKQPEPAGEDPLAGVSDAIEALVEFASEDAINAGGSMAGGLGCIGPNIRGLERHIEAVLAEVRKLMRQPEPKPAQAPAADTGLLTIHNPDKRGAL